MTTPFLRAIVFMAICACVAGAGARDSGKSLGMLAAAGVPWRAASFCLAASDEESS